MIHIEVRKKIIEAYENEISINEICRVMQVKQRAVYRLLEQKRETGSIEPQTHTRGRKPSLTAEHIASICELLSTKSDATLQEIKEELELPAKITTIHNAIHKLGFRYKKKQYMPANAIDPT
jgi:putative transposase